MPLIGKAHFIYSTTGNLLDIATCNAVHLTCVDSTVRKRELNWYVKVEERKP